ncbi:MAG: cytochrome c maturation protein CcmE [Coriobacteriaceae bacterium]|nr:cytochrome c maturation protein CcmE [Coriobacteriaceae bacterium]
MANKKQQFIVVGGIVVIVLIAMLAFFGANASATVMTVAEASQPDAVGKKVEVTGNVVNNSFDINGDILTFHIADPDEPGTDLPVRYDRGVSATFGNGVTAICTGTVGDDGTLVCSELVTKCPSKYETATDALTVERLLGYDDAIIDKTVKVAGVIGGSGPLDVTSDVRFDLVDAQNSDYLMPVEYQGALSDDVVAGTPVVLQGSLNKDGFFVCTQVSLEK